MVRVIGWALSAAALTMGAPALAEDEPRFCPTRPNLGGSSCTTEPGRIHVEVSALDWQRDDQADQREDRIVTADFLVRLGIGKNSEVQLDWVGYGRNRTRDKAAGTVDTVTGTGDVTFAIRQHLAGDKQKPFSAGVQAFVTAATGRYPVGAGSWSTGIIVPVQYELTKKVAIAVTAEADAAANQSGTGRHLAYSEIAGLRYKFTERVTATAELSLERDDEPDGHETLALAALSAAWRPTKVVQLDILASAGLNHAAPGLRLVTGGAILF